MSDTELHLWYETCLGKIALASECKALDNWKERFCANCLLQLGGNEKIDYFKGRFKQVNKIYCNQLHSLLPAGERLTVQGAYEALPFLPESIDLTVAFHTLDFADKSAKQKMIKEIYTTLAPEGYAIIICFNPFSLWSFWRRFGYSRHLPKSKHLVFNWRLSYWLRKAGFYINKQQSIFFRPPLQDETKLNKLFFLEGLGALFFNGFGAISIFFVQKRLPALIKLSPSKLREYLPIFSGQYAKLRPSTGRVAFREDVVENK